MTRGIRPRRAALGLPLVVLLLAAAMPAPAQAPESPKCAVPAELLSSDDELPKTRLELRQEKKLKIVAIGAGSTEGRAAGSRELAYPQRLGLALQARYPRNIVEVINKGVAQQSAKQMVSRFVADVLSELPTLVIWEVGVNDAVRGVDIDEFGQTVQAGIDMLRERKVDVIVMNMQYSRATASIINFEPYLLALHRIADINDVVVFPRYEMMKYWSESGIFDFSNVPAQERPRLAAKVYDCIARRLADMIAQVSR